MSKDRFNRERIHDSMMKMVIIRLDYSGVIDIKDLVKIFDKHFPRAFKERFEHHNQEFNIQLRKEDIESIHKTLSVPINVISRETITRYHKIQDAACDATLDISKYYLCMTVKCNNNYDGLDRYVSIIKGAITTFKKNIPYFSPKRFGLRKVRIENKRNKEEFNTIFEDNVFFEHDYELDNCIYTGKEYVDIMVLPEVHNLNINVRAKLELLKTLDGHSEYMTTLDIDAYYNGDELLNVNLNDLIDEANLYEFNIYKSCMKESYLETIYG